MITPSWLSQALDPTSFEVEKVSLVVEIAGIEIDVIPA
jgi:hypothetical protein